VYVRDCNLLLKVLGSGGHFNTCRSIFDIMLDSGGHLAPSVVTYTTLISTAGKWGKVELAERYYTMMVENGVRRDSRACNSMINAYAKAGMTDRSLDIMHEMSEHNVQVTVVTFNTLLHGYTSHGKADLAEATFAQMQLLGIEPNEITKSPTLA
jgi:pentatricopeptide repeat protein